MAARGGAPERVAAIVLAAGRSRRMGRDKSLLEWSGGTVLGTIRQTCAAAGVDWVRVVLGPDAARVAAAAGIPASEVVVNPTPDVGGPLASLHCGLRALAPLAPDAVLLWPVDHPGVPVETVRHLLEAWRDERPPVVRPTFEDRGGHPVLFDAACLPELWAAPAAEGARAVVRAHRNHEIRIRGDDPAVSRDLDTPDDYDAARP